MRVADFFCGAGGFSEGFRQAGFEICFAVDKWRPAITTYKANKPQTNAIVDDVIRISKLPDNEFHELVPDTEVIIGSPPCQAFSSSNKSGNGDKTLGIELLEAYLRIVARKKYKENSILRYWVLENVPNIKKYIKEKYTSEDLGIPGDFVLSTLNDSSQIYNAKYFGAPTNRKRFLCGEFPVPTETHSDNNVITLGTVLKSLGEPLAKDRQFITDCNYNDLTLPISEVTDHQYLYLLEPFEWKTAKRLKEDKGYMGKMSFPENINKPARTVMATMSASSRESMILASNDKYRLPTVREVATMMSFPLDYRFYGTSIGVKYTLVGNAVPPKLSYALAVAMKMANNENIPNHYLRIQHDNEVPFINLNYQVLPTKKEKPKKISAVFRYHIPYLILDAYRVELTNSHSNFTGNSIVWDVELHYSQGKEKAKSFLLALGAIKFNAELQNSIDGFINNIRARVGTPLDLQLKYCMTYSERLNNQLLGPFELLEEVRRFIDNNIVDKFDKSYENIEGVNEKVPSIIYIGYYILQEIIKI